MDKHDTLLLACSVPEERKQLREILRDNYYLLEAVNPYQLCTLLDQNRNCIAAVVSDMAIREQAERELSRPFHEIAGQIPLIIMRQGHNDDALHRGFELGAADVIEMDYDSDAMLCRIDNLVQLHLHRQHLQVMVEEQAETLRRNNEKMVDALSSIIEHRSVESGQHILRIRHFTQILLEQVRKNCPEYQLTEQLISIISSAAALHDVGKIAIPDAILMKPGKLTAEEREVMKTHAEVGCRILDSLGDVGDPEYLRYAKNICHYHHERWDGTGYPQGLSGDSIPICAQVVGLADAYDALTSSRVYKEAYSFETAVNMILRGECGAFSPKLLECFKHVADQYKALARAYADGLAPQTENFDVSLPTPAVQEDMTGLNIVQGKYLCLLHYINGFVLELSVDQGHHHLRYNPYPELAAVGEARDFREMERIILDRIVMPDDRQRMYDLIHGGIREYLRDGLRRQSFRFRFRGKNGEAAAYSVTLLRANVNQKVNRSLAVLCKKIDGDSQNPVQAPAGTDIMSSALMGCTYCCHNDRGFTLVSMGEETSNLAGYSPAEIETRFDNSLILLVHPEDREMLRTSLREQLDVGSTASAQYRVVCRDGSVIWVLNKTRLTVGEDGREYLYSILTDISQAREAYDQLRNKLERYEIILKQTENVLFEWNIREDTVTFSDTWEQIFGFTRIDRGVRKHLAEGAFFHPDDILTVEDAIANIENGSLYQMVEVRIATARGRYLWCRFRATALQDENGVLEKICGIIINIDAEKQTSQALQERAELDALTKLLNKYAGRKQAEEYFARYPQGPNCAMLMIDLDNFKQVNDRYGHLFGDAVLTQAARTLKQLFRRQDILARIGGDEFMVLMRGISDPVLMRNRCQQLLNLLSSKFQTLYKEVGFSCSIGIALSPQHGTTYYELYKHADQALYRAKAVGKSAYVFYDESDVTFRTQARTVTVIDSDHEPGLAENNMVQHAFQGLYASKNVDASINEILDLVGRKMNVSRVYVFENSDDNRFCSNTYEWCNEGIQPEIGNLQNISYETDIPDYADNFDEDGIFYCPDINILPERVYNIVAPQGIKSMLHCAIRDEGVFRGYIGFDECVTQRMWTKEQIDMLTYLAEMLSVFLLKKREQERALRQAEEFRSILDNQNAWIYIIDPETCELKYVNAKTRELAPNVKPGMRCYKALMGQDERCAHCPSANILQRKTDSAKLHNAHFNLDVVAEATLIRWDGAESCLLTCRECTEKIG